VSEAFDPVGRYALVLVSAAEGSFSRARREELAQAPTAYHLWAGKQAAEMRSLHWLPLDEVRVGGVVGWGRVEGASWPWSL
jgi:hypothetical protein